jgi:hypothetical protein
MLHVNEDNNDELFRKAAEDYSLRANTPDWETLLNKINVIDPPAINETINQKKKRQYRFLFLFNGSRSIFRIFRFSSWLEKSKKKIDWVFCTRAILFSGKINICA